MSHSIKNVSIIGLGLIGGSLGMTIKRKDLAQKIIGIHYHPGPFKEALKKGAIDEGTENIAEGVNDADLVFICTPISVIVPTLKTIAPHLKEEAIVTDVGSAKSFIVAESEKIMKQNGVFIGGHPMAGSERTGIGASSAYLFDNAVYILTPTKGTDATSLNTLKKFLEKLDVQLIVLPPEKHDFVVAAVSHLPLVVAVSLVNTIDDLTMAKQEMLKVASSGFRDTTRIAAGSPLLGKDLCVTNKDKILEMIGHFKDALSRLENYIRAGSEQAVLAELEKAKKLRESMYST